MIVATEELPPLAGSVAMVDGAFDPLHPGHVAYFAAARELGLPVLCNVASDEYLAGKHRPLLPAAERAAILDAIRHLDYVHVSGGTTADVLRTLRPRYYVKGDDWRGRLPQAEIDLCAELGVEIVYLDTVTHSSTEILRRHLGGTT